MLKCPKCGTTGPEEAPPEVMNQKFYKLKHGGYYVCLECTRRFSTQSNVIVS